MKKLMRKIHRWLGLLMALQIIAWMVSGLYFSIFPIETIRGEHLVREAEPLAVGDFNELLPPGQVWASVESAMGPESRLSAVSLYAGMGNTWYRISGSRGEESFVRMVDALNGELMPFLDANQVRAIAGRRLAVTGKIDAVELVEHGAAGSEYRGRKLPLWRVSYTEPENLRLYIDGWTGEVVARRTTRWRVFDFLWMLHIMDFDERDDFNTPLLQIAAALGLLVALSGVIFWLMTTSLLRRRRAAGN